MKERGIQNPVRPVDKRLFSLKEAADYLGISIWTMRGLTWNNSLRIVRFSRRIYVDRKDLDNFIEKNKTLYAV